MAGTIRFCAPPEVPVRLSLRLRAVWEALLFVRVSVTVALAKVTSAEPTMASSRAVPKLVLVVEPQEPVCSPVPISSIFSAEYVLAISVLYAAISTQLGVCVSIISFQVGVCESFMVCQFGFWFGVILLQTSTLPT